MKKLIAVFLVLTLLCGCAPREKSVTFTAKVLKVTESSLLLESEDQKESGICAGSQIYIPNQNLPEGISQGSVLQIEFDGLIMESWPLQLGRIYSITFVD